MKGCWLAFTMTPSEHWVYKIGQGHAVIRIKTLVVVLVQLVVLAEIMDSIFIVTMVVNGESLRV